LEWARQNQSPNLALEEIASNDYGMVDLLTLGLICRPSFVDFGALLSADDTSEHIRFNCGIQ
jgi:hypothetical protein